MAARQASASALIAAQDRLIRAGYTRERAASRLLPQQSPASASRYLRKLRTGERSGTRIAQTERIRKRVEILAPVEAKKLFAPGAIGDIIPSGKYSATIIFETTRGKRAANVRLPRPNMSAADVVAWPGFEQLRENVTTRWGVRHDYAAEITAILKVQYHHAFSRVSMNKPMLTLGSPTF